MFSTVLERIHKPLDAMRLQAPKPGRPDPVEPTSFPQGNLGVGSVTLRLIGWRPRKILPDRSWQARLGRGLEAVRTRLVIWHERAHSRYELLDLDDRALKDIGLDRASAHRQGALPFWRGE
jgi:uncharacterized protein YjiS (DUF1127 family)